MLTLTHPSWDGGDFPPLFVLIKNSRQHTHHLHLNMDSEGHA